MLGASVLDEVWKLGHGRRETIPDIDPSDGADTGVSTGGSVEILVRADAGGRLGTGVATPLDIAGLFAGRSSGSSSWLRFRELTSISPPRPG